jgi:hypothetical protein
MGIVTKEITITVNQTAMENTFGKIKQFTRVILSMAYEKVKEFGSIKLRINTLAFLRMIKKMGEGLISGRMEIFIEDSLWTI